MSKVSSVWECQSCGSQSPRWAGKCPECGTWNSLVETPIGEAISTSVGRYKSNERDIKPVSWRHIRGVEKLHRPTLIGELDRVLGGGLVPGGVSLIAGEPGIGKSTLLSQAALSCGHVLYVNGEESDTQVASRLTRLSPKSTSEITLFSNTNIDAVLPQIDGTHSLVIIDSIQVMYSPELKSAPGSIGQIRECALKLINIAKSKDIPILLVGHYTKSGEVAGPKLLEHMVDAVIVLEGERSGNLRILRAVKNRFGPVDEVGLFAMEEGGMREVTNPAELLIGEHAGQASGSVLGCVLEGQRPLVLEVQALTVPSKIPVPRRVGQGINERRLQLLCAVIEKHLGLGMGEKDVFVNVAGGLRSQDPGLDLAVAAAIVSSAGGKGHSDVVLSRVASRATSLSDRPIQGSKLSSGLNVTGDQFPRKKMSSLVSSSRPIFCGEVGLLGEVRMVQGWERREKEIKRLGLGNLVGKERISTIRDVNQLLQK